MPATPIWPQRGHVRRTPATAAGERRDLSRSAPWPDDITMQPSAISHQPFACYVDLMADKALHEELKAFVAERDWAQFHSTANLAKSISIEAAELLECFQWSDEADEGRVREELADVLTYCLLLADRIGVDPDEI